MLQVAVEAGLPPALDDVQERLLLDARDAPGEDLAQYLPLGHQGLAGRDPAQTQPRRQHLADGVQAHHSAVRVPREEAPGRGLGPGHAALLEGEVGGARRQTQEEVGVVLQDHERVPARHRVDGVLAGLRHGDARGVRAVRREVEHPRLRPAIQARQGGLQALWAHAVLVERHAEHAAPEGHAGGRDGRVGDLLRQHHVPGVREEHHGLRDAVGVPGGDQHVAALEAPRRAVDGGHEVLGPSLELRASDSERRPVIAELRAPPRLHGLREDAREGPPPSQAQASGGRPLLHHHAADGIPDHVLRDRGEVRLEGPVAMGGAVALRHAGSQAGGP
mmetsp:Transcript_150690/g.464985  ORF Transcript_150690/g.464985 Transcript_150690/m.464985 type:complete len:333 (+) Transcript_150690:510-1508(+)